jgi:hypothetical protein
MSKASRVRAYQSRLPFPKEILFDTYRQAIAGGTNLFFEDTVFDGLHERGLPTGPQVVRRVRDYYLGELDRCKVFVLTKEALDCVLATAARLRDVAPQWMLEPPAVPMWVEFEDCVMGDVTTDQTVKALHVLPTDEPQDRRNFSVMRMGPVASAASGASGGDTPNAHPKDYVYHYRSEGQEWDTLRRSCPRADVCPLARAHSVQHNGHDFGQAVVVGGQRQALAALRAECTCWREGAEWTHLLYVLFAMLRADGAEHTVVERRVRYQLRDLTDHRKEARRAAERAREWNRTHPVYVRIALNHRVHVHRERRPDGSGILTDYELPGEGHYSQVVAHWRLLIPGEGRPWRGSTPRVVLVRGHERYVHGKRRVRFHVVP